MDGVGDEVAPGPGDALEAAQRLGRQPREDLDDQIVGEVGRRAPAPLLHPRGGWGRNLRYGFETKRLNNRSLLWKSELARLKIGTRSQTIIGRKI